ncbi:NAD(P)/FAD-dependent oxidoreductase [Roseinatronobacter bogoriensis]|nr:glycine oxidase [Rhodobaca bogoriensis DSM 18756]TDW38953.1 glycine oxidase [Rhodobaca barguzinensis]TDY68864.1 glycine oxidase [Rhodobaca bogoriensis DSM 18756]
MADITIMGAGAFGLSLALVCAERGARVHVIEKRHIGAGSSGGLVGALAPHVPENWNPKKAFQFDALRMAEGFWARVATLSDIDPGYARLGRVQPVTEAALDLAQARASNAEELWQGFANWRVIPAQDAPGLPLISPSGWVIHDTLSARIQPRRAGQALAAAVQTLGGRISFGDAPVADGLTVWATGYEGLQDLSVALGRPIGSGVKGQSILLQHACENAPQIFADGLHIVPHADGTVAIGSTSEREFTDASSVDGQCDELLARARAVCPALQDAPVIDAWAGVRPRAKSRAPLLGPWPGREGHFVFNGGFKIGFAMAPILAGCMADLVLEGRDTIPDGFGFGAV